MMAMDKIIHYQVALTEKDMNQLKAKTEQTTAVGALTTAVEHTLSTYGGGK